jgi:glucosamine--fructose-6-phosphate aminotransferase (isomerizing)
MCGIVGYVGPKHPSDVVVDGLTALEYRGYDSAGLAVLVGKRIELLRTVGRVQGLRELVEKSDLSGSQSAIGHTRWATHGVPSVTNAHPHANTDQTIFVVHNGIIENYQEIKSRLQAKGYQFASETDTEVVPQLIDYYVKEGLALEPAFKAALKDLRGAYALLVISTVEPDTLLAAKLSSPLVLGIGDGEMIIASDPLALVEHTKKVVYLEDGQVIRVTKDTYHIENLAEEKPVRAKVELLTDIDGTTGKGNFPHFMLKEIYEAPNTLKLATAGRVHAHEGLVKLGGLENVAEQLRHIDRLVIVACGTSSYAGMVGEYFMEELAGLPTEVQLASEFVYRDEPLSRSTAVLAISQSGETADTISALKKVENYGCLRLGVVNAVGSTIARMTDAGVYCHAGPEQAVASTKAFIAQVTVLLLIALYLNNGKTEQYKPLLEELEALPDKAAAVLSQAKHIEAMARKYAMYRDFLFIGRRYAFPCALEGALKLKECSYIHAEGYAAGEMKHGPLAMIDPNFPTFALACDSPLLEKTLSNIQEIRARKGPVVAIATEGNKHIRKLADDVIYVPDTLEQLQPVLAAIVEQLFAYYVAVAKGLDMDRPRNLAKSVTVE